MVWTRDPNVVARSQVVMTALEDYRAKWFPTVSAAAKVYGVPESTLRAKIKGRVSRSQA
jgi:hypothetical protein